MPANKSRREPRPEFFATPAEWRASLEKKHSCTQELWVGFYKRDSGRPSITWPEAVDGALCFGWIDGVRKSIDAFSYKIRFTPRKPRSIWSAINIKRAKELAKQGLMHRQDWPRLGSATGTGRQSTPMNRGELHNYRANLRENSGPSQRPGHSFSRSLPGTAELQRIGLSARKGKILA